MLALEPYRHPARKSWPHSKVFPKTCGQCERPFFAVWERIEWCSDRCREIARGGVLCECGAERPKFGTYCDACRVLKRRDVRKRRRVLESNLGIRGENHRARARRFGVEYEPVRLTQVYERDRWVCQLCRRRVDPHLKSPHPLSKTIDHIVPMSQGGGHVYANVQLAHRDCNTRKGVRGEPQQLALI